MSRASEAAPRTSPGPGWTIAGLLLPLFLLLPLWGIVGRLDWARLPGLLLQRDVVDAFLLSLRSSAAAMVILLLFGTPLAWLIGRGGSRWRFLETILDWPLLLPPTAAGLGLLMALGRGGFPGAWLDRHGLALPFTTAAVVLTQVFVASPLYVKALTGGFLAIPGELFEAAECSGASPTRILFTVALPMARPALVSGLLAAWARALGELGATLIFAGNLPGRTQTAPLAILQTLESDLQGALALALLLSALALGILAGLRFLWYRPGENR